MDKKNLDKVISLRRELHRNPEPSNQEVWTKNRLIGFLKENTKLEIVDGGKFFYAIYRAGEDRRNIAFRADFDAILMDEGIELPHGSRNPGVSHKCGHDGHSASLAGFALEVDQKGAEENVFFIFQHAEETGDGGAEASVFIEENHIEEIFAYHNMSGMVMNSINIIDGTTNFASRGMTIRMTGKQSHASQPEMGRNPAFAIARVIDGIPVLVDSKKNRGEVLATVVQVNVGDRAFGISAGKGDLLLTIRAEFEDELDGLQENLENNARAQAQKDGIKVEFIYNDVFPVTSNSPESADRIREAARRKGFQVVEMKKGFRGSEDFGHYLKKTKGAICYIGNGLDYPAVHTHEYDFPDEIIETAVELFKELAGVQ
jgi:amidohydrolase